MTEFIVELVALVVMAFVIYRYVVPPVRKMLRSQQEAIRLQVEGAQAAHERLTAADLKFKEAVAEARTEAAKIRDAARADAQRIAEEMREFAQREVERIRQRGQDELETQRQQVIRELRQRIGELTVTTATELVTSHLSDDAHRVGTVDRLLDELEAMTGAAPSGRTRKVSAPAASGKGEA